MSGRAGRGAARLVFHAFAAVVTLFLLAPLVISLLVSFFPGRSIGLPTLATGFTLDWYGAVLADPLFRRGLTASLQVATLTAGFSLVLALPLVVAEARRPWVSRLGALVVLPALVPTVVLGMQSLVVFERVGLRGTRVGLALAHTLWGLPLAYLVLRAAYRRLNPRLREAARSLGAGPVRAGWEVTLPLLAPSLVVGALLAFVASINELVMSLFLAGGSARTLPTVIWPQVRHAVRPDVAAASSLLLVVALGTTLAAAWVWRHGQRGPGGRGGGGKN